MDQPSTEIHVEFRDFLRILWRRKLLVVLSMVVVVGATVGLSYLQTPVYAANAQLLLQTKDTQSPFNPVSGVPNDPGRALQTEIQVLKSRPVRAVVEDQLGVRQPVVTFSPVGQTDVIEVRAESTSPALAAKIANAYGEAFVDLRRTQAVEEKLGAAQKIQDKIKDFDAQIAAKDADIDRAPASQKGALQATRESLVQAKALFQKTLDELQVVAGLTTGGAQLISQAEQPTVPVRPRPVRSGILALFGGLIIGLLVVFAVDYFDDSVKTKDDLEHIHPGLIVAGLVPMNGGWKPNDPPGVVSLTEPMSPAAEAYRTLRTSIQFQSLSRSTRIIQVTSANASEGKTTTLANVAVAMSRANKRVIVVCCDLRRPRIHEFFGLDNAVGFTSVLLGQTSLSAALQRPHGVDRLMVLASGPLPPNPSELLGADRTQEVLTHLAAQCDIVLIDTPPVLPVTDALVLANSVDGTLLVVRAGSTTRQQAARAFEVLDQVGARLIGTVLNGVSSTGSYGYTYGYSTRGLLEPDRLAPGEAGAQPSLVDSRTNSNGHLEPANVATGEDG